MRLEAARDSAIGALYQLAEELDEASTAAVDLGLDVSIVETSRIEIQGRVYRRYGVHVVPRSTIGRESGTDTPELELETG